MSVDGLLLPWALASDGALVHHELADHEAEYRCPGCEAPVSFRRGHTEARGVWRAHFSHDATDGCTGESAIHMTAKCLVARAIRRRDLRPQLVRRCLSCDAHDAARPLPEKFDTALLEAKHPSGRIVDVLARATGDGAELAIEIRNTHAVDEAKARDLVGAKWIELRADAVLAKPERWVIIASSSPWICDPCVDRKRRAQTARDEALREQTVAQWMSRLGLRRGEEWRLLERLMLLEPAPLMLVDGVWVRRAP